MKNDPKSKIKTDKVETSSEEQVNSLKNQLARALADYDNLRKRTEEEKLGWIKFATQKFIAELLPVMDNFESAQNHLKDPGLAMAINQFKTILKGEGLEEIRPEVGETFDENFQEAIEVISGDEEGKIAEVVVAGWKFSDDLVVRHAKVKVTKVKKTS